MKKIFKYTGIGLLALIVALLIVVQLRQNRKFEAEFPARAGHSAEGTTSTFGTPQFF